MLTACPFETRKICLVFTNCVVGRWANGSRHMKIVAFSMISIAPANFMCHIQSVNNKGYPKYEGGPRVVISLCVSALKQILKVS